MLCPIDDVDEAVRVQSSPDAEVGRYAIPAIGIGGPWRPNPRPTLRSGAMLCCSR